MVKELLTLANLLQDRVKQLSERSLACLLLLALNTYFSYKVIVVLSNETLKLLLFLYPFMSNVAFALIYSPKKPSH